MPASSENGSSSHSVNLTTSSPNAVDVAAPREALVLDNSCIPKPKRLACMICRKRKLKCDGVRPSCSTCSRLNHCCAYDEQRRKSGPKRGYVKALEERLKQVETLLKSQEPTSAKSPHKGAAPSSMPGARHSQLSSGAPPVPSSSAAMGFNREDRWAFNGDSPRQGAADDLKHNPNINVAMKNAPSTFTWEMIGLGLEEPLPPQKTIDELHQIYFDKVHHSVPMIHRYRYLAAMNLCGAPLISIAPALRPPVCLRYAMWALACSISDKYSNLMDLFYQRARKYVEADYMKGYGEHMISVAHCQTHILLTIYEMKMMYFPRAWINTGSAVRLAQMMGLHRLDGVGLEVKQCLPPAKDWTEREERRRTFWMAFCQDRYASIGTGWPMTIHEQDILTNLPSSEKAFEMNRPEKGQTLEECTTPAGAARLSSFGGTVLMACLFGRNLVHLHRPDDHDEHDRDLNSPFWKRHRQMDSILLNTSLSLPPQLKLPGGLNNPNVVFTNMSIHTSTICLHQAAIHRADKQNAPNSVSAESKMRCFTAANEIAGIMRAISHLDLSSPEESYIRSGGPVCDDPDGVRGILSYRDDCNFTKGPENEDNAASTPDLPQGLNQSDALGLGPAHANGYGAQSWVPAERKVPVLTPNSGSLYERNTAGSTTLCGFESGHTDERDATGSPDGGHSAGRTPISSGGASDHRPHAVAMGPMGPGNTFQASPISPQQPVMTSHSGADGRSHQAGFYPTSSGYVMADMPSQHAFSMSSGWGGMGGQVPGMQPVGEGVLRALMTMGPMDAMDLSSWESGNPR
ncbi:putative transcriptional regulatory protein [Escovopsis weberi]|uniref:Putative transcriptional regulatory protein n=1 Tax=Escovopsis weberi TaxID=150374 RepID=A0A0M8MWJ4_ESCWE|nr:putative transcriptional regulatory protein [Escovopsis weberi]